eukprot:116859-Chlamydomonas_euryale.AAC.1
MDAVWVVFIFLAIGAVMLPIGAVCLSYGLQPNEALVRYDQTCFANPEVAAGSNSERLAAAWAAEASGNAETELACTVELQILEDMPAPVYFFYELSGFYQNNYRYVESRSYEQLVELEGADTGMCSPQVGTGGTRCTEQPRLGYRRHQVHSATSTCNFRLIAPEAQTEHFVSLAREQVVWTENEGMGQDRVEGGGVGEEGSVCREWPVAAVLAL